MLQVVILHDLFCFHSKTSKQLMLEPLQRWSLRGPLCCHGTKTVVAQRFVIVNKLTVNCDIKFWPFDFSYKKGFKESTMETHQPHACITGKLCVISWFCKWAAGHQHGPSSWSTCRWPAESVLGPFLLVLCWWFLTGEAYAGVHSWTKLACRG